MHNANATASDRLVDALSIASLFVSMISITSSTVVMKLKT